MWWWATTKLPHGDAPDWALIPGAVLVAFGFQVLHLVTVYYVASQVSGRSQTYGVIGVALSVLAWAYLVGRLVIMSSTLNATLWARTKERLGDAAAQEASHAPGVVGFVRGMATSARSLFQ